MSKATITIRDEEWKIVSHYYCEICEKFESYSVDEIVEHIVEKHYDSVEDWANSKAIECDDPGTCLLPKGEKKDD